jgi:hypothetical protein
MLALALAELEPVLAGLARIDPGAQEAATTPAPTSSPAIDAGQMGLLMEKIQGLLTESDPSAGDVVDELATLLDGTPHMATLQKISRAIADFDFDVALEHIATLRG